MRKQIIRGAAALLALTGLTTGATADGFGPPGSTKDLMPMEPAFSWTGLYLGGHLGYRRGEVDSHGNNLDVSLYVHLFPYSVVGGLQGGYNYQLPGTAWVLGIEGDVTFGNGSESFNQAAAQTKLTTTVDASGSLRGRLGWALDRTLFFATAGVAWQDGSVRVIDRDAGVLDINTTNSRVATSWIFGGGVEHAITRNWTLRLEYLYSNSDAHKFSLIDLGGTTDGGVTWDMASHTLRAAINYKF